MIVILLAEIFVIYLRSYSFILKCEIPCLLWYLRKSQNENNLLLGEVKLLLLVITAFCLVYILSKEGLVWMHLVHKFENHWWSWKMNTKVPTANSSFPWYMGFLFHITLVQKNLLFKCIFHHLCYCKLQHEIDFCVILWEEEHKGTLARERCHQSKQNRYTVCAKLFGA
jgi:hypothetical protein